jgi:hypothetical protein
VTLSEHDAEARHHALVKQIAHRKDRLRSADSWEPPGNIGWCVRTPIREAGVDSTRLDQLVAPHWPTLWGLAARSQGIHHDGQPVRTLRAAEDDGRRQRLRLSSPIAMGVSRRRVVGGVGAARLVLIETFELAWHRAKHRHGRYDCAPADRCSSY